MQQPSSHHPSVVPTSVPGAFRPPSTRRRGHRPDRGFALVVALSLMILLTVVAVGLLGLAGISLRTSAQGEAMATARANARLSLMLALGQLQETLGPDRKVSAPADLAAGATPAHGSWVGVYDSWPASKGVVSRPKPEFSRWLVSAPDPEAAKNTTFATTASAGEVTLVGTGTLGKDGGTTGIVTAPVVPTKHGRMAWWVADESMKAHVVAGDERPAFAKGGEELLAANAGISPQAVVLEKLGEIELTDSSRRKYLTPRQLGLKSSSAGTLFHDVTTESRGLAVDVTRGRFKLDYSLFSQLPRKSVEGLPLYKADGKINSFSVANGRVANEAAFQSIGGNPLAAFANPSNQPGINLEELWVYSNLYRNLVWSGNTPELRMMTGSENPAAGDFRRRALSDPWFSYSKPVFAAVQFVFSFVSKPDPAANGKFRMLLQMDALVKVWNPNNVRVVIPPGSSFAVQLLAVPFQVQWQITNAPGTTAVNRPQSQLGNNTYGFSRGAWPSSANKFGQASFQWLRGNIGGLATKGNSTGYTLEPGECKIFGHDKEITSAVWGSDPNVNLSPGWGPGRQALIIADFGAGSLNATDTIEFVVSPDKSAEPRTGNRTYCNKWIGERAAGAMNKGGNGGLALGGNSLPMTVDFNNPSPDWFPPITSSQRLQVSQYSTPKPFMIFGHYLNVEQPSSGTRDAFPSAPRLLTNGAITSRRFRNTNLDQLTAYQEVWRTNPLPLAYDSPLIDINAKDQGRFGGGHNSLSGVSRCATRQIDAAPPLSLMSLTHAIANGFADRFGQAPERGAMGLDVLQSDGLEGNFKFDPRDIAFSALTYAAPQVERAIGNSFASPFIASGSVTGSGLYHSATGASVPMFDHSYLANAALFDGWFCSSLHDGRLLPKNSPFQDNRTTAGILKDFIQRAATERDARLLNPRVMLASRPEKATERLLDGANLHPEAIARIGAHVWLDGAFNVNSTRKDAWKAVLATARDQAKRSSSGQRVTNEGKTTAGSSGLAAAGAAKPSSVSTEVEQWSGFRALGDDELDSLASRIVEEVKTRGPFLSLADFINRRPSGSGDVQWMGAVQAAIARAGLNNAFNTGGRTVAQADFGPLPGASVAKAGGGLSRSAGIPGYLMQSDVLAPFANELTARGDTFRIRGYGAATDAAGKITAEVWCEAVVQRLPEYVDPGEVAETAFDQLSQPANRRFGRRFSLIAFQWLPREAV